MALYQVDIEKQLDTEFWTNVYHVDVTDLSNAIGAGTTLVNIERTIHLDAVTFTKFRVRPYPSSGNTGTIVPVGELGQNTGQGAYIPLWNTLNVVFGVATGRPSRKYLKLPIPEASQTNGTFIQAFLDDWQEQYADAMQALDFLVDVDGQNILTVRVQPKVGMRQLRRGSKRRLQPII